MDGHGHHHLHIRKRHSLHRVKKHAKKMEPYPARTPWKRVLDKFMLSVGVVTPLVSIPQILLIYFGRDATGVSPITFFMLMIFNILWFTYGMVHRATPIIILYTLWFVSNALIFIGALIY